MYPKLHRQPVLPGTATAFSGHATHELLDDACTAVEYVFAGHSEHAALPFVDLYVPAGHALQLPLEGPVSGPVYPVLHEHHIDATQLWVRTPAT